MIVMHIPDKGEYVWEPLRKQDALSQGIWLTVISRHIGEEQ